MSQLAKAGSGGGSLPSNVPTSFIMDDSTIAVPSANRLGIISMDVPSNNLNGIQTTLSGSSNVQIQLTNRLQDSKTTSGAVTSDLIIFSLGSIPSTQTITVRVSAYESSIPSGAGYNLFIVARTNGTTATLIGNTITEILEDPALTPADVIVNVVGNVLHIQVVGVAGLNISWNGDGYYTEAS